ncbi:MAG: putative sulfate exporter family transporter, partial [Gammaproteobacteria bacterium]|nr:putative sulfate exporter family transporter [Gammaproteobacteria bacterium]
GFVVLAALNSIALVPVAITETTASISRWALLTAIAAVGMKTSLHDIFKVGAAAVALLVAETLFLASFVTTGVLLLGA